MGNSIDYNLTEFFDEIGVKGQNRLTPAYLIKPFDCDERSLNDFLLNDSKIFLKYLNYTTFILETDERTIAYFSLANDLLTIRDQEDFRQEIGDTVFDASYEDIFFQQDTYPAVKIGMLGVDKAYQGHGIGRFIIESLVQSFVINNKTGCQFITVDAINCPKVLNFYENNKFHYLTAMDMGKRSRVMYKSLLEYSIY